MECRAKSITDDLKDVAVMRVHRGLQDGVMAFSQYFPFIGMSLCEFGTAFDIREEEGDGAGGLIAHCLTLRLYFQVMVMYYSFTPFNHFIKSSLTRAWNSVNRFMVSNALAYAMSASPFTLAS